MLKNILLVTAALSLFAHTATANSNCNKNAWLSFVTSRNGNGQACGQIVISSGKGAWDMPTATAMKSISACAYSYHDCSGSWVDNNHWNFCCTDSPDWKNNYSGKLNVEFDCSDGLFTCGDVYWN
ncbi:hypothetical protein EMPS_07797 [Entomortierella parvispora]|uniref:Cyanovirin-N domain-containing protein n=1 Tax=Entomortierella parvispora TaxID=205924 RepID=A0A9P3HEV0_9FUNG|nr:hypothetical protein EMPS_07797 [Entomortierella parvispora]